MARFSDRMVTEVVQTFWAAMARGEFITDAAAEAGTYRTAWPVISSTACCTDAESSTSRVCSESRSFSTAAISASCGVAAGLRMVANTRSPWRASSRAVR